MQLQTRFVYLAQLSFRSCLGLMMSLICLIISPGVASPVYAQGAYPQPQDTFVNDYAHLLEAEDAANVRTLFAGLKRETGIEAVVVTIGSVNDYQTGAETVESFATNLFNTWGIGDEEANNGVLILVAVKDRKVRIEVGASYENTQNAAMQEVINEHILPSFRQGHYSRGIYRGARAVVGKLTGEWPADLAAAQATTRPQPARSRSDSYFPWLALGVASIFLFFMVRMLHRTAGNKSKRLDKRLCPHCHSRMIRLDEFADDLYLDPGQQLEEVLLAVDYEVWQCPACHYHQVDGYDGEASSLKKCPACTYQTVVTQTKRLREPTFTTTGQARITETCLHCNHTHTYTTILPELYRPPADDDDWSDHSPSGPAISFGSGSSSGGGSFGGGHASGGGASDSW
jgi:uncharacterized protein